MEEKHISEKAPVDHRGFWVRFNATEILLNYDENAKERILQIISDIVQKELRGVLEGGRGLVTGTSTASEQVQQNIKTYLATQSAQNQEQIINRAIHQFELEKKTEKDPLTQLLNKTAFRERSLAELSRLQRLSVEDEQAHAALLVIDIDDFRNVNTRLGHSGGDRALTTISQAMRDALRISDLGGRIGGDELSILLVKTSKKELVHTIGRIFEKINGLEIHNEDGAESVTLTLSVGVSLMGPQEINVESTTENITLADVFEKHMKQADAAAYMTKKGGKNGFTIVNPNEPGTCTTYTGLDSNGIEIVRAQYVNIPLAQH